MTPTHRKEEETARLATTTDLWHRRLGHVSHGGLRKTAESVLSMPLPERLTQPNENCGVCPTGKATALPHNRSTTQYDLGELLHCDTFGTIQPSSLSGAWYFTLLMEQHRHLMFLLVRKSVNSEETKKFIEGTVAFIENQTGKKVKTLRTDPGTEFVNLKLALYLREHGIKHEKTIAGESQQNGVIERAGRTVMNCARSMLHAANLPGELWAEAVSTAVYLINRRSTTAVGNGIPLQIFSGRDVNLGHLRVFGCKAFVKVAQPRSAKFAPRSKAMVFVGYPADRKGYRVWDPTENKDYVVRDVTFHEQELGYHANDEDASSVEFPSDGSSDNPSDSTPDNSPDDTEEEAAGEAARMAAVTTCDPKTYREALASPDKDEWVQAMREEETSLDNNQTF